MSTVVPDSTPGSVHPDFLQAIKQTCNVLDVFILHKYDYQFDQLRERLAAVKKDQFDPADRIIVVHFDSDYYIHNQFGINLINLFTLWQDLDIPLHAMLIYTNHIGIQREIDLLCKHRDPGDRPTVIETFVNQLSYDPALYEHEPDLNVDQIVYHGLSLMGHPRSHRYALYNHLKHLSEQLVMVIKAK